MYSDREIHFDILAVRLKAQDQDDIFRYLAQESAPFCTPDHAVLFDLFQDRLEEINCGMGEGVAVFDLQSPVVCSPVLALITLAQDMAFGAVDNRPVDLMAAVLSPQSDGSLHLQRLARLARLLRTPALCTALRDADNTDAAEVLFMPAQGRIKAA